MMQKIKKISKTVHAKILKYQQTKYNLKFFIFCSFYILTQAICFQCYLLIPDFRITEGIFT